jgi:hypothetical protein
MALAVFAWWAVGGDTNHWQSIAQWLSFAVSIAAILISVAIARPVKVEGTVSVKGLPTETPQPALAANVTVPPGGWNTAHVTVTVSRSPAPGNTYWLVAEYDSNLGYDVYAARAKVRSAPGIYPINVDISGASEGSIRTFFLVEAAPEADKALTENSKHHEDWKWNPHRTVLPKGSSQVSNRVSLIKAH